MSSDFNPVVDGVVLTGNANNNLLVGTEFNDQLFGLGGNDALVGNSGQDLLLGGIGHDELFGTVGEDKLDGGIGDDKLLGGLSNDWLFGGLGDDFLWGESGNDDLNGGEGRDYLNGGTGDDFLNGGPGGDYLLLKEGKDIAVIEPGNGLDILLDYQDGQDKLQVNTLAFRDLAISPFGSQHTLISVDQSGSDFDGQGLALLRNTSPQLLQPNDFIFNKAPQIISSNRNTVLENQTSVIDVQSTDDLDSEGSGISYSLSGGIDQDLFDIDARTGEVSFKNAPNFENPADANGDNFYHIEVTVKDYGDLSDVQVFTINVTNVNEAPTITSVDIVSVAENQSSVLDINAIDPEGETENGGGLAYSLTGGADQNLFNIDTNTGVVSFKEAPDFENPVDDDGDNNYEIQVAVTDSEGLSSFQNIVVSVVNVNEAPTITSVNTTSVPENQTSAIDVDATDPEGDPLTYSITGGEDQDLFDIDTATGEVTFKNEPDFEAPGDVDTDNIYKLQVTVTDSGATSDVQDIEVTVTDVVENIAPTITSADTAIVSENQIEAIDVEATDPEGDTENGGGLTYSLTGGIDQDLFEIDGATGEVTFKDAPDFENPTDDDGDNNYEIQVTVTDSGGLSDVQNLTVTVTDVVENIAPTITSADTAIVSENQIEAIDVNASDDNDSEGAGLTYSLTGGADLDLFEIDTVTGEITFKNAPDFDAPEDSGTDNIYNLQVTVTDSEGLTDVQNLEITVTEVVENTAPTIISANTASVPENQIEVINVEATDAEGETENGGGLTYSITGGEDQERFTINENSGEVTFIDAPDFENPVDANTDNIYNLEVTVTDSGDLTDVQSLEVTVTNVIDETEEPIINLDLTPGERLDISLLDIFSNSSNTTQFILESDGELPTGMLEANGTLFFAPTPDELGTYEFKIIAEDGDTETSRDFVLEVIADPLNTTRISGIVQDIDGTGLGDITISVGNTSVLTAFDGSFTLEFSGDVPNEFLRIAPGQQINGAVYPNISEDISLLLGRDIYDNVNNVIDRPIFLPAIDMANAVTIDPTRDTIVTTDAIPGAEVFVEAGSLEMSDGTPFTGQLSITEVPRDLTPANLPDNLLPDLVVTIQPGEMVFTTPAPLNFPNLGGYAPGTVMDLWSINPNTGDFEIVGASRVSDDGTVIETISGGVRNSSWHFPAPPADDPEDPEDNERNEEDGCEDCKGSGAGGSEIEFHSGTLIETHNLVSYQSLGVNRGLTLTYDSLRADPRPIVNFGYSNAQANDNRFLVGELSVMSGGFEYQASGLRGDNFGLDGGENFWRIPQTGDIDAALQINLQGLGSGRYDYELETGLLQFNGEFLSGSTDDSTGQLIHVNRRGSEFGNGWGLSGLHELVENNDGSVLLIDGDGGELLFEAPDFLGDVYGQPAGDFSILEKLPDGTFQRTFPDQTVHTFNAEHKIASIKDRNGNETQYLYNAAGNLSKMIDPVGLETTLAYTNGLVTTITDPAGRETKMEYDADGNLFRITDPDGSQRTWEYDDEYRMIAETDKRGNREQIFYDFAGRVDYTIQKDGSIIDFDPVQTQGLYDSSETVDLINAPTVFNLDDTPQSVYIDANGNQITNILDQQGQIVTSFDEEGLLPSVVRNEQNLITQSEDGRGNITHYTYDENGNVLTIEETTTGDLVTWIGSVDGNWNDAANWSNGVVPDADDNVIINLSDADPAIIIDSDVTIGSLFSSESVNILAGSLTVTNQSIINSDLSINTESSLIANGASASILVTGSTAIDGANLFASNGGQIALPNVTSFAVADEFNVDNFFRASGVGSVLDLSNLTELTGSEQAFSFLLVEALEGGQVDLSGVTQITGPGGGSGNRRGIQIEADGANSEVDLSSLTSFTNNAEDPDSKLKATNNGTILNPNLTTLDGVDLEIDSTGNLATAQYNGYSRGRVIADGLEIDLSGLTNFGGSTLELINGGTANLDNVTEIDGASFLVNDGVTLSLPLVTTFAVGDEFSADNFFRASGVGTVLDLSNLTELTGSGQAFSYLFVEALEGGQVDLSGVTQITGPGGGTGNDRGIQILANGTNSEVDLSSLTSFTNDAPDPDSKLTATNNGTILNDNLITLDGVDLEVDSTGNLATNQYSSYSRGRVTADGIEIDLSGLTNFSGSTLELINGGTANLENVTEIDGASFLVNDGVTLSLPNVTSFAVGDEFSADNFFRASGVGTVLDLSNLTELTGSGQAFSYLFVEALEGGQVDLSGVTQITGPGGGTGNDRGIQILANGTNSEVDLSSLTSFTNDAPDPDSKLTVANAGTIVLDNLTTLNGVDVELTDGGTINLDNVTNIDGASFFINDGVTLSLPNVTSFTLADERSRDSFFRASGVGSILDLSNITELFGSNQPFSFLLVEALEGGQVDLSGVTQITGPGGGTGNDRGIQILANGTNSEVDLSSLTSFTNDAPDPDSKLTVANAGTIVLDNLTTLNGVDVELTDGGTINLDNVTNIDGASFFVNDGVTLSLPNVTSFTVADEFSADNFFRALGAGSVLDLSNLTELTGSGQPFSSLFVEALGGGEIDLSGVTQITGPGGGSDNNRGIQVIADGADSEINLSNLNSFTNNASSSISIISVSNGGMILADNLATLKDVDITVGNSNLILLALTSYSGNNLAEAFNNGTLDLRNLTTIPEGILTVLVEGIGSTVNISSISADEPNIQAEEINGGTIVAMDGLPITVSGTMSSSSSLVDELTETENTEVVESEETDNENSLAAEEEIAFSVLAEGDEFSGTIFTYDETFNQVTSVTDELGRKTLYEIDPNNGNVLSITQVFGEEGGDDDIVTQYTYTSFGLVDTITDPLGRVTDYDYNALQLIEKVTFAKGTVDEAFQLFEYDIAGNQTAIIDENNNRTEFEYDELNRLIKVIESDPDGTGILTSPITSLNYDTAGNLTTISDAENNILTNEYDVLNRLSTTTDEFNQTTKFGYDNKNNLTSIIDPLNHEIISKYDTRDRLIETIDPDDGVTKFEYDFSDNLISVVDSLNNQTTFVYDNRDRLIVEIDPLFDITSYTYDAENNLTSTTDRNGRQIDYTYDEIDRLIQETWVGASQVIDYNYDKASNLNSVTDEFSALAFTYDNRDRIETIDNGGTPGAPNVLLNYTYDGVDNILSVTDTINGTEGGTNEYSYDFLNRLTTLTQSGNNVSDKRVDFGYNQIGQFTSIDRFSDLTGTQLVTSTDYIYDNLNRLETLTHNNGTSDIAFYDFGYDAASRISQITDIDGVSDFSYDDRDQLTSANRSDPNNPDETYGYDANGNRTNSSIHDDGYVTGDNNQLLSDGTYNYEYDKEGNQISRTEISTGNVREFEWDYRNRLIAVVDKDADGNEIQRVEFTYDAFDRRITKSVDSDSQDAVPAEVTHFVYDGSDVHLEFIDIDGNEGAAPQTLDKRYLHGPGVDQVLAQESVDGSVYWHLTDHLGTVRDLVDNSGTLVNHLTYDSFGNLVDETNPLIDNRYLFTGREYDDEIGLYFHRTRYYDSSQGRFLSEDTIGFAGGNLNLYTYVYNNPLSFKDNDGKYALAIPAAGLALPGLGALGVAAAGVAVGLGLGYGIKLAIDALLNESSDNSQGEEDSSSESQVEGCPVPSSPKEKAKDRRKRQREETKEQKHGDSEYQEPSSERYGKYKAREAEKEYGKDARRRFHDSKIKGEGNRSKQRLNDDFDDL